MRKRALIHCYNLIRGTAYLERGSKSSMAHISTFQRGAVANSASRPLVVSKWLG